MLVWNIYQPVHSYCNQFKASPAAFANITHGYTDRQSSTVSVGLIEQRPQPSPHQSLHWHQVSRISKCNIKAIPTPRLQNTTSVSLCGPFNRPIQQCLQRPFKNFDSSRDHFPHPPDTDSSFLGGTDAELSALELYALPFKHIFSIFKRRDILQDIRILILDGLNVPLIVVWDLLSRSDSNIQILSLRNTGVLQPEGIQQLLGSLIRPSRPSVWPKLKGLYCFGNSEVLRSRILDGHPPSQANTDTQGVTTSVGAQLGAAVSHNNKLQSSGEADPYVHSLYKGPGRGLFSSQGEGLLDYLPNILQACTGLIAFDAVLCPHDPDKLIEFDPSPKIATIRLAGCQFCSSCPEGPAFPATSPPDRLPLLSPPPRHSSTIRSAQQTTTNIHSKAYPPFIVRCETCLKDRWCKRCNIWWCETCYTVPKRNRWTPTQTSLSPIVDKSIKVYNGLCVSTCLVEELLNSVGEGGMWG